MNAFSVDIPPTGPNHQRRQALLVLLLGLLAAAGAIYLAMQDSQTPVMQVSSKNSFPVASLFGIDNSKTEPSAGYQAPNFAIHTPDGNTITLADYQGRPVLINFWASWCEPCRREMPDLVYLYEKHKEEGLVIIEINVAESPEPVTAFVREFGMTMPVLIDPRGEVMDAYKSQVLPSTFFIDRNGTIQVRWIGFLPLERMEEHLDKIL